MKAVYLEWVDSASHHGTWNDLAQIVTNVEDEGALLCRSAGFVVHEDKATVTISQSWSPDEDGDPVRVCLTMTIPKIAVTFRKDLPLPKRVGK